MSRLLQLEQVCHKITDGSHNPPKGVELSEYVMLSSKNILDGEITYEKPRYLKPEDFFSENKRTNIEIGDVLLTIVGTIGRCAVVDEIKQAFTLQRSVAVLKPNKEIILPKYLMFALQNMTSKFEGSARGVAQKGIYLKSLKQFEVFVPPLAEQHRIVAKLDAAFAGIDGAISTTENKVNEAKTLFEAFLTNTIENANLPCKKVSLDNLAKFLDYRGKTPKKTDSGVVLLTAKNVRMGYIKAEPKEFISEEEYKVRMTRGFPKLGDVVFTTEAPLGLVAQIEDDTVALGQRLITFQIKNGVIHNSYLKYALMSRHYQQEIYANGTGATVKGIKASLLKKIQITFPTSMEEQTKRIESLQMAEEKTNELIMIYSSKLVELHKLKSAMLAQELQSEAA